MSTDWIKMRCDLRTHPKVVRMAGALNADKLRVVGGLHAVWSIFDAHSEDGILDGYTFKAIDIELGWKGFAQAMNAVGWLDYVDGQGLTAPRFEEHNGQTAKRRAQETERKRLERDAEKNAKKAGQLSASDADKSVTREEKRREEEIQERPRRASRLPAGWEPSADLALWARQERPDLDPLKTLDRFRDYWTAKAGKDGTKLDWDATYRNWVRAEKAQQHGRPNGHSGDIFGEGQ